MYMSILVWPDGVCHRGVNRGRTGCYSIFWLASHYCQLLFSWLGSNPESTAETGLVSFVV